MHKGFPKSDINRDLEQRREALEKESAYQYKLDQETWLVPDPIG